MFFETLNRLRELGGQCKGHKFTPSDFTKKIRSKFSPVYYTFKTQRDYAVDPDMIIVSGAYDSAADFGGVEIALCYHPKQQCYDINKLDWDQLSFDLAECMGHELIHREQKGRKNYKRYRSTHHDPKLKSEQEYLGSDEEIEAYGFSIAAESIVFDKKHTDCLMYKTYEETFDTDRFVVLQLDLQIAKYIKQLRAKNEQYSRSTARRN